MNDNPEPLSVERHDGATLCPMCRNEVLWETNFCPKCGNPVDAAGVMEAPPPPVRSKWVEWNPLLIAIGYTAMAVTQGFAAAQGGQYAMLRAIGAIILSIGALRFGWLWLAARREAAAKA